METFVKPSVAARARTLDARWYISAEVFEQERERIFEREWIYVGHEAQLEQAGDYVLATIANESLIVTRDGSGAVRALFNVCRHRGTRMCTAESGHFIGSIQCPYHAWTYALDGALLAARNMQRVADFDRSDYPLHRAPVAVVDGLVFVTLSPAPEPIETSLHPLLPKFRRWNVAGLREARRVVYDVACNWKLVFQNYSECYHCPVIHPQLDRLSPSDSGRNDCVKGPVLGGYSELRERGGGLTTTGRTLRSPVGAVDGEDLDRVYYYTVFPSMLFSLHPDYVMIHTVRPIAPNRSEVVCSWLFDPETMAGAEFDPSDAVDFWDLTNHQDWAVSELTQLGLTSRAYRPGPYSNAEGLLHAFDRHYLSVMES